MIALNPLSTYLSLRLAISRQTKRARVVDAGAGERVKAVHKIVESAMQVLLLHFQLLLAVYCDLSNASTVSQWICRSVSVSVSVGATNNVCQWTAQQDGRANGQPAGKKYASKSSQARVIAAQQSFSNFSRFSWTAQAAIVKRNRSDRVQTKRVEISAAKNSASK